MYWLLKLKKSGWLAWTSRLLALAGLLASSGAAETAVAGQDPNPRKFIAHRGVHLRSTIAGENSLEAIRLAGRAGFAAIETDVRLTADGQAVIMHDETLNRTCLNADGSKLKNPVAVASVTLAELKANYVLKANESRERVSTLREYLEECKRQGLLVFIEPKLKDPSGAHYRDIIRLADQLLGDGKYVVTSNNYANRVIRDLGLNQVRLMGILYQSTFEDLAGLGNVIIAISTSRFSAAEFSAHASRAIAAGFPIESHADDYPRFAVIDAHPVDYVSTDLLAPDLASDAKVLVRRERWDDFETNGKNRDGWLRLGGGDNLNLKEAFPEIQFGAIYLEVEMKGDCMVRLGNQQFAIRNTDMTRRRHQLLVHDAVPDFRLAAIGPCVIGTISVTVAQF